MFVLGIDPGLSRCGWGAVRRTATGHEVLGHGVLTTPPGSALPARLLGLYRALEGLVARLRPEVVVVERVFFQTNVRTAMSVGQASGLALIVAEAAGCTVVQYTANEVKQAVTGYGAASKEQVQRMVQAILGLGARPQPADAADALALAITHLGVARLLAAVTAAAGEAGQGMGNARVATHAGGVRLGSPAAANGNGGAS